MSHRARITHIVAVMAVIAATTLVGLPGIASADPGEGSISGTVVDDQGSPLENICVYVENWGSTTTDSSGSYSIQNIPVGQYRIQYSDCNDPRVFITQWYLGASDESGAQYVDVYDQSDNPLSTVWMQPGVSVTGNVTDSGANPIENIQVRLDPQGPYNSSSTYTDASGNYRVGPVADGQYQLEFNDTGTTYATEYWDDQYSNNSASTFDLMVSNGTEANGFNAQLARGSTISGHVQDESSNPLANICVNAQLADGNGGQSWVGGANTDGSGDYTLTGLPPGPIHVQFDDCSGSGYLGEWYQDAPNFDSSTPITQGEGSGIGNINATLATGFAVSGRVTDAGGTPLQNVNVSVDPMDGNGSHGSAQTDSNGDYTTNPLATGNYRVRFDDSNNNYAIEYWNDSPTWDGANPLTIDGAGPVTGINAQLALGGRISGTVTKPNGSPAPNVCIGVIMGSGDDGSSVGWAQTNAAGQYEIARLPAGQFRVRFEDCNDTGPFLGQWYDNTSSFDNAQVINLSAGQTRAGVNAQLVPAAQIKGTVRNTGGTPLEYICVQASTNDFVGGMDRTRSDGTYSIELASAGAYKVQFSDCGDPEHGDFGGTYLGQWWGGGIEPTSAQTINVAVGATVDNKDASLAIAGGTGTVTGRVTNMRGQGLQACVVLYMPFENVRFEPTDANGNYSFADVATGTYTVGYLGCGDEDVSLVIPDAGGTGVYFNAVWNGGAPVNIESEGPDPIAQGAKFITVHPNETLKADQCFGCTSVNIKPPVVGDDYILVDFEALGLTTNPDGGPNAAATGLSYSVSCTSKTGKPTSATQTSYPVRVEGFTPGEPYVCSAQVLSGNIDVAASASFQVTVGTKLAPVTPGNNPDAGGTGTSTGATPGTPATPGSGTASGSGSGSSGSNASASPTRLAFTGSNLIVLVVLASLLVLVGAAVSTTSKRRLGTKV